MNDELLKGVLAGSIKPPSHNEIQFALVQAAQQQAAALATIAQMQTLAFASGKMLFVREDDAKMVEAVMARVGEVKPGKVVSVSNEELMALRGAVHL